jgi:hypothetical protein
MRDAERSYDNHRLELVNELVNQSECDRSYSFSNSTAHLHHTHLLNNKALETAG